MVNAVGDAGDVHGGGGALVGECGYSRPLHCLYEQILCVGEHDIVRHFQNATVALQQVGALLRG